MSAVPNVHVRDVPPETLETLRLAARRRGRSLNAEIVAALVERAAHEAQLELLASRLERARKGWRSANPHGYPPGLEPEVIVREARDQR